MYFISVFYLCQFIVGVVISSEQHCTKFNYDEQLLEKMVRMEFNVEKMAEQNTNFIEEMKAEIKSLKADRDGLLEDFRRFKEEIKAKVGLKLKSDAPAVSKQVIAFSAKTVKNPNPVKKEVLVFNDVTTNNGKAYDITTGIFTAPVNGLYLFHDQMCVAKGKDFYHQIRVDNVPVTTERYGALKEENPTCFSAVKTLELRTGQNVSINCFNINKDGIRLTDDDYRWNMFSGVLLRFI